MELEELFGRVYGGAKGKWVDSISPECRETVDRIVALAVEKGREPRWAAVYKMLKREYPEDAPQTDTTVRNNLRPLIEAASK